MLRTPVRPTLRIYLFAVLIAAICSMSATAQNVIVNENNLPGNPASEWDITGAGDLTIQGFATELSIDNGSTVSFKINVTDAASFNIKIYRLGYYQGNGARLIINLGNFSGTAQPLPLTDAATGLVDCGNWTTSASWAIPNDAVSGIYIAKLTRNDNNGASHIVFVVRDDASTADLLFQTSDGTWQAYNVYGGNSLYVGNTSYPSGHAVKVSYNRPFVTRGGGGGSGSSEDWLFNAEYPMLRWLERNGYNVTYATSIDVTSNASIMQNRKVFMSVGHDEYWSKEHRDNIEAARDNGKHLAFFSGNEVYWKTRWENSIDGTNTAYRTLVCYKEGTMGENTCGSKCDPSAQWTGLWRDGSTPPYPLNDGNKPENSLTGQLSWLDASAALQVPDTYKNLRFWRNTNVATLTAGQTATLSPNTLGYELDWEQPNGKYPSGRILMSSTTISGKTHKLSLYRHSSGALVFGAGTVQWSWGLDGVHDRGGSVENASMQQATVNLFADMTVQPGTLQAGLVAASASTDVTPAASVITTPSHAANVFRGLPLTIRGNASDANAVGGVEVSVDGGTTWHAANGTTNWSYTWTPTVSGTYTIKSRSFDDSGNMEIAGTAPSSNAKTINVIETPAPNDGPGGPILVISNTSNPFSRYPVEILRAEGLNEFAAMDISAVTASLLNNYEVVLLGEMVLSAAQVTMLSNWTTAGGTLIAFKPDQQLSGLLGISPAGGTLSDKYLLVNTAAGPGAGIVNQTIQYHGAADKYSLNGATSLATLFSDATTSTIYPAVTTNTVGSNGGAAIAFTYDLARSIVYTRQGNPAWAGDERDGIAPLRSNDLFFGNKAGDPQPDWIDLTKVAIPQADEQQRLLVNIIIHNNLDKKPLPRFWFLPRGLKATVVMTGDDHANNGTTARFNQYLSLSPSNTPSAIDDWTAIRGSSYIYPNTPMSPADAMAFEAMGFEIGLHLNTNCTNWTPASYQAAFASQLLSLGTSFPGIPAPVTNRTHCIAWSDWATQPSIESLHGIRLDANYYYYPGSWIQDRPGMFTGSGMPMRFANTDGSLIDCYQLATQMTDESGQSFPGTINSLLDKAIGPEGYFGVFCANMHTDNGSSAGSDAIIASAQARQVPVISARQMLNWLDGRNNSSFGSLNWNNNQLTFAINNHTGAQQLMAMLPVVSATGTLSTITRNTIALPFTTQTIKGILYAFFDAAGGNYVATYITCTTPTAVITANSPVCTGQPIALTLQSATGQTPFDLVVNGTTYNDVSVGQNFATFNPAEISVFGSSGSPVLPANQDAPSIEVGVKFRSSANGYITGIRFYKGIGNTGTHIGTLWQNGNALATATFTNETASGWQEVRFSTPVAINANTTYVASYFSPNGYYAFTGNYFSSNSPSNGPITLLASGVDGPNGVYNYPGAGYPTSSFNDANYWVDILFTEVLLTSTSLSYTLTSITDANNCLNTGTNLSTANVVISPRPAGTIALAAAACANQNVQLTFTASPNNSPYTLVINGQTINNVNSGVPFNSTILANNFSSHTVWQSSTIGGSQTADNLPIELGVQIRSSVAGNISAVRFYKTDAVIRTYTAALRDPSNPSVIMGSGSLTTDNTIGWKQINFTSPVSITANTTYIASYYSPGGYYAFTANGLNANVVNSPLTALAGSRYRYGGGYPDQPSTANYWVDVVLVVQGFNTFNLTSITDVNGCNAAGNLQNLTFTSTQCAPLPVSLMALSAIPDGNKIKLKWTTAMEQNNLGFEVQRSFDGISWMPIGFVNGAGNSSSVKNYVYIDENLLPKRYFYRLKQVDIDNRFTYSNIVSATLTGNTPFTLGQNYPNPFHGVTTINFTMGVHSNVKLSLYDGQGRLIKILLEETVAAGEHLVNFDGSTLAGGIYYYKLESRDFTEVRKMIVK